MPLETGKTALLSDSMDAQLAAVMRRIESKHDSFTTDFIGTINDDGTPAMAVRLEGWRIPETKSWGVNRYTYVPALDAVRQDEETRTGLCFIDALAICARFQSTELALNPDRQIVHIPGKNWENHVHFTKAAEDAGQVIDNNGILKPCAFGRVLAPGLYDQKMLDIAAGTKGMALEALPAGGSHIAGKMLAPHLSSSLPGGLAPDLYDRSVNKIDMIKKFKTVKNSADSLIGKFEDDVRNRFMHILGRDMDYTFILAFSAVATLGIWPACSVARGGIWSTSKRSFRILKEAFVKAANELPECREKTLSIDFARAAEGAYWLERAALKFDRANAINEATGLLAKGLPDVRRAATAMNLGTIDAERLESEYLAGKLTRGEYFRSVERLYKEGDKSSMPTGLKNILETRIGALKNESI